MARERRLHSGITQMLPKRIHQYCGTRTANQNLAWIASWKEKNPNFEHYCWTEASAAEFIGRYFGAVVRSIFVNCRDQSRKELIFCAAILFARGGFYIGTDMECRRSIEPLTRLSAGMLALERTASARSVGIDQLKEKFVAADAHEECFGQLLVTLLDPSIAKFSDGRSGRTECSSPAVTAERSTVVWLTPDTVDHFVQTHPVSGMEASWDSCSGTIAPDAAKATVRWVPFLFLGHPRCGSASLSATLRRAGLRVGHERLGEDGAVSWWQTGRRLSGAICPMFSRGKAREGETWLGGRIFHYIRDPRDSIPSIMLENEVRCRANPSFQLRRRTLMARFDIDIGDMDAPVAAAASYALWNELAAQLSSKGAVRVENPEFSVISPSIATVGVLRSNLSVHKFGMVKPDIDVDDAIRRSPREVRLIMERFSQLYDGDPKTGSAVM
ncbi:MAG TPA: hypothetical protein VHU23_01430 [Rhizomicrobium sp.]|jgi:hypothetical protein|nr:hypothetical protein [Rhizomicrobium sp.]